MEPEPLQPPIPRLTRAAIKAEEEAQDTMDVLKALTGTVFITFTNPHRYRIHHTHNPSQVPYSSYPPPLTGNVSIISTTPHRYRIHHIHHPSQVLYSSYSPPPTRAYYGIPAVAVSSV